MGALFAGLCLGACASRPPVIEVSVSNWPGYEYLALAAHEGLDRQQGIQIRPVEFPDPQDIVHAYLRGDMPIAQLTTVEAVDICARAPERCPVVVLVLDESLGGDVILARPPVDSVAALKGRRVAVVFSTLGPYVLSRALQTQGLSLDAVRLRGMDLTSMADALARGDVDAAVTFPPLSDRIERQKDVRRLFDSRSIPGEIFDVLVVDPGWLREHRSQVAALVSSWQQAQRHAQGAPGPADALMARRQQVSVADFRRALKGLRFFPLQEQLPMLAAGGRIQRNLAAVQRVQQQLRLVPAGGALPPVDPGPVSDALQR